MPDTDAILATLDRLREQVDELKLPRRPTIQSFTVKEAIAAGVVEPSDKDTAFKTDLVEVLPANPSTRDFFENAQAIPPPPKGPDVPVSTLISWLTKARDSNNPHKAVAAEPAVKQPNPSRFKALVDRFKLAVYVLWHGAPTARG